MKDDTIGNVLMVMSMAVIVFFAATIWFIEYRFKTLDVRLNNNFNCIVTELANIAGNTVEKEEAKVETQAKDEIEMVQSFSERMKTSIKKYHEQKLSMVELKDKNIELEDKINALDEKIMIIDERIKNRWKGEK